MKKTGSESDWLCLTLIVLLFFMSFGWYFAESENEILRQEIAVQGYSKPVQHQE